MTPQLSSFVTFYTRRVNQLLASALPARVPGGERLLEAMTYSLTSPGKRVRPTLAYASAMAVGGNMQAPLLDAAACALEIMHAYSLIHDDLPAMDNDDLRRGKPTCHIAFDEATAILAGDALQCLAFETLLKVDAPAEHILQVTAVLAQASGATGMVVGQAIDMQAVASHPNLDFLELMHSHKTGALIQAAVLMGAKASGLADLKTLKSLKIYAKAVGLAFQVQDDILDVTANTQDLGKPQGSDVARHKPTYVSILGVEAAQQKAQQLHEEALDALSLLGQSADILRDLSGYIVSRTH